jgi:acyl dehydratase
MAIDPDRALGAELSPCTHRWDSDNVILYHLGVGAGTPPTDPQELAYTYEPKLRVLPSFAVLPAASLLASLAQVPGLEVDLATLLHGEQDVELAGPIPSRADVTTSARVAEIFDKGSGALVVVEGVTRDGTGEELFVNRFSAFLRGAGGFGGERGAPPGNAPPDRRPDVEVERRTLPQQALLYRLSGDKNPLHADPEFAKLGGFDRPILHGLCTYGIVCKAVVDEALAGDVSAVARYQARFAGVTFPGETIAVRMWRESDKIIVEAFARDRAAPVLTNAALTLH